MTFFDENFADAEEYGDDSRYTYFICTGESTTGMPALSSLIIYHRLSQPMPAADVADAAEKMYGMVDAKILCWSDIHTREDLNTLFSKQADLVTDKNLPLTHYSISYAYEDNKGAFASDIISVHSHGIFNIEAVKDKIRDELMLKAAPAPSESNDAVTTTSPTPLALTLLDWAVVPTVSTINTAVEVE